MIKLVDVTQVQAAWAITNITWHVQNHGVIANAVRIKDCTVSASISCKSILHSTQNVWNKNLMLIVKKKIFAILINSLKLISKSFSIFQSSTKNDSHHDNDMLSASDASKFYTTNVATCERIDFQLHPRQRSNKVASADSKSRKLVCQLKIHRRVENGGAYMQSTESRIRRRSNNLEDGCASPSQIAFRGTRTKVDKQPPGEVHSCADASGIGYR